MSRIIFFGCSLTYGHGLPDCHIFPNNPKNKPSMLGWPVLVSNAMNKKCVNNSSPGASNKKIWNSIINFKFNSDDIVFIHWSFIERYAIIKKNTIIDIGTWSNHHDYYSKYYDNHDAELMSKLFINHANWFLEKKNLKVYNLVPKSKHLKILNLNEKIDYIPVYIAELSKRYPAALDDKHPGLECQSVYARQILDYLEVPNTITMYKPYNIFRRIQTFFSILFNLKN